MQPKGICEREVEEEVQGRGKGKGGPAAAGLTGMEAHADSRTASISCCLHVRTYARSREVIPDLLTGRF